MSLLVSGPVNSKIIEQIPSAILNKCLDVRKPVLRLQQKK